jgi:hypothetical protein
MIATAGSCFAQEVGKYLANMPGVTLFRAETAAPGQPSFSALFYGNVYTVRQLVQLFDRAFGRFNPVLIPHFDFRGLQPDAFHLFGFESVLKGGSLFSKIVVTSFAAGLTPVRGSWANLNSPISGFPA